MKKLIQVFLSEELYEKFSNSELRQQCSTDSEAFRAIIRKTIEDEEEKTE